MAIQVNAQVVRVESSEPVGEFYPGSFQTWEGGDDGHWVKGKPVWVAVTNKAGLTAGLRFIGWLTEWEGPKGRPALPVYLVSN